MTKEEIYNIVESQKWTVDTSVKVFNNNITVLEYSDVVAFWNENIGFCIHAIRDKNHPHIKDYSILQHKPILKTCFTLEELDGDWAAEDIKSMTIKELINDEKLHYDFLHKN